jgi:hypothetical protein
MNNSTLRATRVSFLCLTATFIVCLNLPGQMRGPIREPTQFPPGGRQPQGAKPVTALKMRVEDGKVTADITETLLQNVLSELAERTGIIFEVRSQDNSPVSIHVNHIPVQEFIQRIASGSNAIFLYGSGGDSDRITLARIYPRTPQIQQPALIYLGTGAVTKTNNTVETSEQALQVLSGNASIEDREQGIELLVKNKGDVAVKALMNCMSDPAPEIRSAAIEGLAAINARVALPGILKSLKDEHPGVRQSAVTAVAILGDAANIKDLRPLSFEKDASVAAAAEMAIRKLSAIEKK